MSTPIPSTRNEVLGEPESLKNSTLETAAGLTQSFQPPKRICAHLNAFHAYASDPSRAVETNHYCAHLNNDVRQCLLYDSPHADARLIGIEYMIKPYLYETLDPEERKLWHSHVYEVKSGMLIMPKPAGVPESVWEVAENAEMGEVILLYGKVYHLWQTDRGDQLPLGMPQLMTSFIAQGQLGEDKLRERDKRFGTDSSRKAVSRKNIAEPTLHPDIDSAWES